MKLELGKEYLTESGKSVKITSCSEYNSDLGDYREYYGTLLEPEVISYNEEGEHLSSWEKGLDIVEEVQN